MNNDMKKYLTYDEAVSLLPDGEQIHTFVNPITDLLIGADWSRKEILDALRKSTIQRTGPEARKMGHGIVVCITHTIGGKLQKVRLFIETDAEKLAKFEEAQNGSDSSES